MLSGHFVDVGWPTEPSLPDWSAGSRLQTHLLDTIIDSRSGEPKIDNGSHLEDRGVLEPAISGTFQETSEQIEWVL